MVIKAKRTEVWGASVNSWLSDMTGSSVAPVCWLRPWARAAGWRDVWLRPKK